MFPGKFVADIWEFDNEAGLKKWIEQDLLPRFNGTVRQIQENVVTWVDDTRYLGGAQAGINFARELMGSPGAAVSPVKTALLHVPETVPSGAHFDYDVVVIGGGSGGLAFSKRASTLGAKVCLLDFVKPSAHGTTWGLGGTCVNVGCIPKKLMHTASIVGHTLQGAVEFGWGPEGYDQWPAHNWSSMVKKVQDYIHSLNFGYRVQMREQNVEYKKLLGKFLDPHTVECTDADGKKSTLRARRFLIAVGGRPKPLGCPGDDLAISSDDLFSLSEPPGKTLVVGASYVALECAGFIHGLGFDTTVMVRSILLRGFDRDMSERVGAYMEKEGVAFVRGASPTRLEKQADGKIRVFWGNKNHADYDTVIAAVGRNPDTSSLGLAEAGVQVDAKTAKLACTNEQTNVPHIYALGDVLLGKPELTPVAIQAGKLLAERLFNNGTECMDYKNVCTTVFTPLEYSCVGLTEEEAVDRLGGEALEVYHSNFLPLEWTLVHGRPNDCYLKVLVDLSDKQRVVGMHYLGPNAGEVILGYGAAIRKGMTFRDLSSTIGIHPTTTEEFTLVNITKRSGLSPEKTGC